MFRNSSSSLDRPQDPSQSGDKKGSPRRGDQLVCRTVDGRTRLRTWVFRIVALVVVPTVFFLVIEFGLRFAGMGYPTEFFVPDVQKPGFMVDNYRFAWRFFPRALARAPQPVSLSKDKPPGTIRVIVFGGSAAMGDPEPAYGLPRMLEVLLDSRFPDHDFQVVNAAVTAVNSHVVLPIARDCLSLNADAWVIYLGNNEVHGPFGAGTVFGGRDRPRWLVRSGLAVKRTKIGQVLSGWLAESATAARPQQWGGMEMFLNHQIRHDDPRLERVYGNFCQNLTDIVANAQRARTPIVVSTVVTNLKDSPPFVSIHRAGMSQAHEEKWDSFFELGCIAQTREDQLAALDAFAQASEIDSDHAELNYRQGQCYLQLGRLQEAREQFRLARDHDALRFRADSKINDIITSVAESRRGDAVVFVDANAELSSGFPGGLIGDELLYEHVHLNFTGNYRLAKLLAKGIMQALSLGGDEVGNPELPPWLSEQGCADQLGLTLFHRLLITREMRDRLDSPPFSNQLNHASRDQKLRAEATTLSASLTSESAKNAVNRFRQRIESRPEDWVLREQFAALLDSTRDLDGAIEQYRIITGQLTHYSEGFFQLGALLNRIKNWRDAELALRQALALRPNFARAANSLGICLSHQQRYEESIEQFRKATELQPTFAEAFLNWGLVLAKQGDEASAIDRYRAAVSADANYYPAQDRLGKTLVVAKDYRAALPHYRQVARLRSNDPNAHLNLGLLCLKMGDQVEASIHLQRTLELEPENRHAQNALNQLRQSSKTD